MKSLLPILLILSYTAIAQKMKLSSGNLYGLKNQTSYTIQFTYDSLIVGDGIPEKNYLNEIKNRWETREPGKGASFVEKWYADRKRLYEPAFIQNFEKYSELNLNDSTAQYTLILKTFHLEGGWNVGVANTYATIAGELQIVESTDHNNVKAIINFYDARGETNSVGDFAMTGRIKSAYASAGQWLAIFLQRKSR